VERANLEWVTGDLSQPDAALSSACDCDVIIHTAMSYKDGEEDSVTEQRAIDAMLRLERKIIYTGNLFTCTPADAPWIIERAISGANADWRNVVEAGLMEQSPQSAIIRLGFVFGGTGCHLWAMLRDWSVYGRDVLGKITGSWPMIFVDHVADLYLRCLAPEASGFFHAAPTANTAASDVVLSAAKADGLDLPAASCAGPASPLPAFLNRQVLARNDRAFALGWRASERPFGELLLQAQREP
jgi:hypothetical protein